MNDKVKLELGKSPQNSVWYSPRINNELEQQIALKYSLPLEVASYLANKNISVEEIDFFLNPAIKNQMPDPLSFQDMDKMLCVIYDIVKNNKTIAIFGDYDVDGATSTALLVKYFNQLNIKTIYYIPDRKSEGYGPNIQAFRQLKQKGADLIICVDCGTMSFDVMEQSLQEKIDVCIIDHHIAEPRLPESKAFVNPNRLDDKSGMGYLSAVGVVFFVLVGLNRYLRKNNYFDNVKEPNLLQYLDLVALGTVCDVMTLTDLNRAFVAKGIKVMQQQQNKGLKYLANISGISEKIKTFHLGFILGPRLNAGGRMDNPTLATEILLCDDDSKANELATLANLLNQSRQNEESEILNEINIKIDEYKHDNFICVYGNEWNEGVIGICASRLKEEYNVPSFVISFKNKIGKGSVRSSGGVDVGTILLKARQKEILESGGGHKMAGGFTLHQEKLTEFLEYLKKEIFIENNQKEFLAHKITSMNSLNIDMYNKLKLLEPYGVGNTEPRFVIQDIMISSYKIVGKKHISCYLKDASGTKSMKSICFNCVDSNLGNEIINVVNNKSISLLGKINLNSWNNKESINFVIEDIMY